MRIQNILANTLLASALAVSQNLLFVSNQYQANAQSSIRPFVVFVNGYQNGRAWGRYTDGSVNPLMKIVKDSLPSNSEIWYVPWDRFVNGANQRSSTSNDAEFLRQATDYINNQLNPNRPLILIGHSYGGDSLLSLAPRIKALFA